MQTIKNPILQGFNPDPSIIKVGDDFYIATSTFEWFPGVQIHHSKELANWELVTRPLDSVELLDMRGVPDSCGVWAPCLSYDKGTFYLVYSNVRSFDGVWKDTPNYLVTTTDIRGKWSNPVFLNSKGFDGSLFHDEDGRKWYVSMVIDHRKGKFFGGIILQEFSVKFGKLIGPVHHIFEGTELGITEGPHIYKYRGYYYLITAEGGTEYGHAVTVARSKNIIGPYEIHPQNPIISTAKHPDYPLQRTGHADIVWTSEREGYIVFLASRPLPPMKRCTLGRETAIEEIEWREDDWFYVKSDSCLPRLEIPSYEMSPSSANVGEFIGTMIEREDFEGEKLNIHYQSLRVPISEEWCSLEERKGFLRLKGRQSLSSTFEQSLVARRVQHFDMEYSTCLDFQPQTFQHLAGLVCYYNTGHYYYLHLMGDMDGKAKWLNVICCDNFTTTELLEEAIEIALEEKVFLKAKWQYADLRFFYSLDGENWQQVGGICDGSILSDDYVREGGQHYRPAFTGSFVGVCCQDLTGNFHPADFEWVEYEGR